MPSFIFIPTPNCLVHEPRLPTLFSGPERIWALWEAHERGLRVAQVAIEADQMAFQLYKGGILSKKCGASTV